LLTLSRLCISTVVLAELYYGAARHPKGPAIRKEIGEFVSRLAVIPWDETAADHYGQIRAALEKAGTPIGAMDMMIAAHARSQGATLVSNNIRHFDKAPGYLILKFNRLRQPTVVDLCTFKTMTTRLPSW